MVVFSTGGRLRGGNVLVFIDNNAVLCSITRAWSRVEVSGGYVAALWWPIAFLDVRV